MPMWNKKLEAMPRKELEKLQGERLAELVAHVDANVPFYKKKFKEAKVKPEDIKSLDDLKRLPFTMKEDLRDHYPFGMFAVPVNDVVRIHASSGTTGKPTVGGYNKADMEVWGEVMARTLVSCGVTAEDIVHNAYGYGLFTGGLGFHLGAETVGCTVVPISGGMSRRQILLMEDFGATILTCTPSYALALGEEAADMGRDFKKTMKVRAGIFGAEPWSERMRTEIEAKLGLEAYDIYGLTEIIGPGVSVECEYHNGLHIFEDHFLAEIIDPITGEQLPFGEEGELVFTTLSKQAMPMVRYRTRDRTVLHADKCKCGRTIARMEKVLGRTDDMLIIRGVNVFPQLVERTLLSIDGLEPHYQILIDRPKDKLDILEVWIEASASYFSPVDVDAINRLRAKVEDELAQTLGVSAKVELLGPRTLERSLGKAKRVVDKREL
ncbi:MAG: phenylacetate--CoA ligase [Anaerolineales bacterium]